jgi:hypothetical protein
VALAAGREKRMRSGGQRKATKETGKMKMKMTMETGTTKVLAATQKVRQEIQRDPFLGRRKFPSKLAPRFKMNNTSLNANNAPLKANNTPLKANETAFKISPCMVA